MFSCVNKVCLREISPIDLFNEGQKKFVVRKILRFRREINLIREIECFLAKIVADLRANFEREIEIGSAKFQTEELLRGKLKIGMQLTSWLWHVL